MVLRALGRASGIVPEGVRFFYPEVLTVIFRSDPAQFYEMRKVPLTIRDLQVLFTAELSVSRRLASVIAGKHTSDCCDIDFFSANLMTWYDGENAVFFDYSINGMKYAAILLLRQELPLLSGYEQLQLLRKMKKIIRFTDYKDLWYMLIIPERLTCASEYPAISWNELEKILCKCRRHSGIYLAQMLKCAAGSVPEFTAGCLTLN